MTHAIAQLWYGSLNPSKHSGEGCQEIKQLENYMQHNLDRLEPLLSEPAKHIFQKYNTCVEEYILVSLEQAFCDGFCLGAKLTAEALVGAEKITRAE